jgi:hypothetical protein
VNRRYFAISSRAIAIVLLIVAAFRLAIDLGSSLEIDETIQDDNLATISHRFAVDPGTATVGLVGVAMFWGSFLLGRKRG